MKNYLWLFACLLLLSSCGKKGTEQLPVAIGEPYHVMVVAADSTAAKPIVELLAADMSGLPQPEPTFDVQLVKPEEAEKPQCRYARALVHIDIDKKKIEYAKTLGYSEYTDDVQTDVVLEGTGNGQALARCLRGVKPFGRVVLMGNPGGAVDLAQADYWQILRKELTVYGTWNSAYREASNDWAAVVEALQSKTIHPELVISQIMPLREVNKAFSMLTDPDVFTNRIVLKID